MGEFKQDPLDVDINDVLSSKHIWSNRATTQTILQDHNLDGGYAGLAAIAVQDRVKPSPPSQNLHRLVWYSFFCSCGWWSPESPDYSPLHSQCFYRLERLGLTSYLLGRSTLLKDFSVSWFWTGVDFDCIYRFECVKNIKSMILKLRCWIRFGCQSCLIGEQSRPSVHLFDRIGWRSSCKTLGGFSGIRLITCLILMLTLLPAIWVVFGRNQGSWTCKTATHSILTTRHQTCRIILVFGWGVALWVVIAMFGTPNFRFENNLENLFNRDVPATKSVIEFRASRKYYDSMGILEWLTWKVFGGVRNATKDEPVLQQYWYCRHLSNIVIRTTCLSEGQTELIERQQRLLQTFAMGPVQWAIPAQQVLPLLDNVSKAVAKGPPAIEDLPDEIKYQLTTKSGKWITYAYGHLDQLNSTKLQKERLAAEAIQPTVREWGTLLNWRWIQHLGRTHHHQCRLLCCPRIVGWSATFPMDTVGIDPCFF